MNFVLISIIILCIIFLFLYIQLRSEIKSFKNQLYYTEKEGSTFTLFSTTSNNDMKEIIQKINSMKEMMQDEKHSFTKNEKEIRDMIANISHDIRTPLTSIQGYVEMMQTSDEQKDRERYFDIVSKRLQDLESMLDEFFLYTKLMSTNEVFILEKKEIYPNLCQALLGYVDLLKYNNLEPQIICEDEHLCADIHEDSLRRICVNLLINTVRYGKEPFHIYVKKENDQVLMIFENGCKEDTTVDLEHMFDRFYKGDPSRNRKGSGLGLAIVNELVGRMNGSIKATYESNLLSIVLSFPLSKNR